MPRLRDTADPERHAKPAGAKPATTILAGIDPRADGYPVVARAAQRARDEGAELVVAHVCLLLDPGELLEPPGRLDLDALEDGRHELLDGLTTRVRRVETWGDPAAAICNLVRDEGADLLVVSGRRSGRRKLLRRIDGSAACPVEMVDEREEIR